MKRIFKFKERVKVIRNDGMPPNLEYPLFGRIWEKGGGEDSFVGVKFDKKMTGHVLPATSPHCADDYGWYVEKKYIRRIK